MMPEFDQIRAVKAAVMEVFRQSEADPRIGGIIQDARVFIEITKGQSTPWAENLFGLSREIRDRYKGLDFNLFEYSVNIMRESWQPSEAIPDVFLSGTKNPA